MMVGRHIPRQGRGGAYRERGVDHAWGAILRRYGSGRVAIMLWALLLAPAQALASAWTTAPAASTLSADVGGRRIQVRFYRPGGTGPFPLVILSHGSPRNPEDRPRMGVDTLRRQAEALAALGIAVAMPLRRGYGGQGEWAEAYGSCEAPDYAAAGLASAADIRAAMAVAAKQPDIDGSRIVLVGHSAGGWGSLAAASQGGVMGVVDFAGGRGSPGADTVCGEENLLLAAARLGSTSPAPELWIFSRNDHFFGPALARRLHEAFTVAGGRAELVIVEPYRDEGHAYIDDTTSWTPRVARFLRQIRFLE